MTERRSQGRGKPRARERAITPRRMLTAGATVKMADETATRRSTFGSMPSFFARFQARTMKRMLMAMTNRMTTATRPYMNGPLGSNTALTPLFMTSLSQPAAADKVLTAFLPPRAHFAYMRPTM